MKKKIHQLKLKSISNAFFLIHMIAYPFPAGTSARRTAITLPFHFQYDSPGGVKARLCARGMFFLEGAGCAEACTISGSASLSDSRNKSLASSSKLISSIHSVGP
jgi:hypothetical protein